MAKMEINVERNMDNEIKTRKMEIRPATAKGRNWVAVSVQEPTCISTCHPKIVQEVNNKQHLR